MMPSMWINHDGSIFSPVAPGTPVSVMCQRGVISSCSHAEDIPWDSVSRYRVGLGHPPEDVAFKREDARDPVSNTLMERGERYGDFHLHAEIAQSLQDIMRGQTGWVTMSADKRQALTVIADKIARILNGDPEYVDNWHDIQGYARLVEDRLRGVEDK